MDNRDLDNWKLEYDWMMFKVTLIAALVVGAVIVCVFLGAK